MHVKAKVLKACEISNRDMLNMYDCGRSTVGRLANQVVVRRNSWLQRLVPEVTMKAKIELRYSDLITLRVDYLFISTLTKCRVLGV